MQPLPTVLTVWHIIVKNYPEKALQEIRGIISSVIS